MKRGLLVAIWLFLACPTSFGQPAIDFDSANAITPYCHIYITHLDAHQAGENLSGNPTAFLFADAICVGSISAVVNLSEADHITCPPLNVTHTQMIKAVVQYIDRQPARSHEMFAILAREALQAAWPCR